MRSTVPRNKPVTVNEEKEREEGSPMASNTPKKNRTDQIASEQKLSDGLSKHAQTITSIVIGGTAMTTKDIIATLQTLIASANTVQSAKATWQSTIKADQDERTKLKTFVSGLKQALLVAFAGSIDTLADFGLTARKVRVLTPEQKTAAAAKAKATRAARHTVGTKQKKAIKGTVPTTAPAAPTTAPMPTPAPSPAPAPAPVQGATHQS
jgi:hypothetical protein